MALEPVADETEEEQLALFEGSPVYRLTGALGGAGGFDVDEELHIGDEVSGTFTGRVVKVVAKKREKGRGLIRQHTIYVEDIGLS